MNIFALITPITSRYNLRLNVICVAGVRETDMMLAKWIKRRKEKTTLKCHLSSSLKIYTMGQTPPNHFMWCLRLCCNGWGSSPCFSFNDTISAPGFLATVTHHLSINAVADITSTFTLTHLYRVSFQLISGIYGPTLLSNYSKLASAISLCLSSSSIAPLQIWRGHHAYTKSWWKDF